MRRRPAVVRSALAAVIAASLAGLPTACTHQISGLDGTVAEGTSADGTATPGRPQDFTAYLDNHTGHIVTLKIARLLPLKGFKPPRLIHEAVEQGRVVVISARDWPPSGRRLHLRNFAGYRVLPGHRVNILYSVEATKIGNYADAGIAVTALVDRSLTTVNVISFAATCVIKTIGPACPDSFTNRVQGAPNP